MEAKDIVNKMYAKDGFSQWLGVRIDKIEIGYCKLSMTIRPEMTNGFGAFAFASNSHGFHAVSIETAISHTKAIKIGDAITAEAILKSRGKKLGIYDVTIKNQNDEIVALFKGTVFIKEIEWS
jgi:acyl-CoA thioesterase